MAVEIVPVLCENRTVVHKGNQKMRALQVNLCRGRQAQDLLMRVTRERKEDVILFCKQCRKPGSSLWYQDTTRDQALCNNLVKVYLETDKCYVWVEVSRLCLYS